jgi:hypothetical protein
MRKVPAANVVTALEATDSPLPAQIQEALGELVGAAREGLLALSVAMRGSWGDPRVHDVVAPYLRDKPGWRASGSSAVRSGWALSSQLRAMALTRGPRGSASRARNGGAVAAGGNA